MADTNRAVFSQASAGSDLVACSFFQHASLVRRGAKGVKESTPVVKNRSVRGVYR